MPNQRYETTRAIRELWRRLRSTERRRAPAGQIPVEVRGSYPACSVAGSRRAEIRRFYRNLFSCFASLCLLASCALTNRTIEKAGGAAASVYADACKTPANRKLAAAVLVNGALTRQQGVVLVCCPDDKRAVCNAARKYYADLFDRAAR